MNKLIKFFLASLAIAAILAPTKTWATGACTCARFNNFKDHGCHKAPGGAGAPPSGADNAGGNKANCPTCPPPNGPGLTGLDASDISTGALGMPRWWVDEPYINLHVVDEPLNYTTSSGQKMSFQWYYKQCYDLPRYDQIPDLFWKYGGLDRIHYDEFARYYVEEMRSYGTTNGYDSGMTNAAWANNWNEYIVLWDSTWEAGYYENQFYPRFYQPFSQGYEALAFMPDGGINYFTSNVTNQTLNPSTQLSDPISQVQLQSYPYSYPNPTNDPTADGQGIYWGSSSSGLKLVYPDGSQDVFGLTWWAGPGISDAAPLTTADALLTQRIDPQGRVTKLGYRSVIFTNSCSHMTYAVFQLTYVIDPDNRTTTFIYKTNAGNAWELQEVDDPFGRKATFGYESCNGWIASITDAQNNTSSFTYQPGTNGWISSLITPYGTNNFYYYGQAGDSSIPNSFQQRAIYVTEPDSASQLFCYLHTNIYTESSATPPTVPGCVFDDGTDGGVEDALFHRNSFYWDRQQTANLSSYVRQYLPYSLSAAISDLQSTDLKLARMRHWLLDTDAISVTETLSSERDPSPDAGGTTNGNRTWYSYAGSSPTNANVLTTPQVGCIAQILSDGSTQYTTYSYYSSGLVANNVQSYSLPNGTIGQLTNSFSYAANGIDLTHVGNSMGQYVNLGYNGSHEPLSMTNSLNQVTALGYDSGTHNLTSVALYTGQTIGLTYYSSPTAFLNYITLQPENKTATITAYSGPLPQIVHVTGTGLPDLWQTNAWDNLNRLTGVNYQDGTTIANIYTYLDLSARKDRLSNWTHYTHDGLQHLTSITDARTNITQFSWCNCGALTSISNALGNQTFLNYNNQELLTNVNFPDGSSMNWQYDLIGRVTKKFDGSGNWLKYAYNNQSLVTAVSNAYGLVWGAAMDAIGRPLQVTNINNVVHSNTFDLLNHVLSRAWMGGGTENFGYAANGLVAYTNQDNQWTHFGRDGADRMTAMTNAAQTNLFSYNALDELTSLIDGLNDTTSWSYNQYGWLTSKANTLGTTIMTYSQDADGRVTNRWMMGTNTQYRFDAVGNLTNIVYPSASYAYQFDAINELTNMADSIGTTAFSYTAVGRLQSETGPWPSDTVSIGYNQGHRTSLNLTQPSGSWMQTYGYDSEWRMNSITSPAGAFGYSYATPNPASALISGITLPNWASIANNYDGLARLTSTALLNYWGHTLDGYGYGLDLLGLRTNITRNLGLTTNTVAIGYDGIDEVTSWSAKEVSGQLRHNEQLAYAFDAAGNLHTRLNDALVQTFNVDALNQLSTIARSGPLTITGATPVPATNVTVNGLTAQTYDDLTFAGGSNTLADGANSFTIIAQNPYGVAATNFLMLNLPATVTLQYDANGNLTNDGTRVFSYDAENQLTNVAVAGQWQVVFLFDGLNRRRIERDYSWQSSAWKLTNETRFICDGMQVIQERDTNNNPVVTYTRGLDVSMSLSRAGGIAGMLARTDANGSTFYHSDANGNVTALMDGNQNIVARAEYDGFGKFLKLSGSLANTNRIWFSSKEYVPQAGIYDFGFRFYEPNFGRALNHDPIGERGGYNLYRFNRNSPVNLIDPNGLTWALFSGEAWGQLTHDIFIGDHPQPPMDPNSYQALKNQEGVGPTQLTDANGNRVSPGDAVSQVGQAVVEGALQAAMMLPLGPEEAGLAAAEDAAKAAKAASKCEKASEKAAKAMARQIGKDLGKDAQRAFHDAKEPGSGDRTMEQLRSDAQALYEDYGVPIPKWIQSP